MKLGLKIILPILLLFVIILGAFGYILFSLKQQQAIIFEQGTKIQKLNGLNELLIRQQEQTDYDVLSYRFNHDKSFLLAITQAELDKSKTLDEMYPFIMTPRGRELINNYIDTKKDVESLRTDLIIAIDDGNQEQINLTYNKWSIQTRNIKSALADIGTYNINSLEKTIAVVEEFRTNIVQVITLFGLVIIIAVMFFYFYLRNVIANPIISLTLRVKALSALDFSSTTTTTTDVAMRKDEIGMLMRSFNIMAVKLKESYATLEEKIVSRTSELVKKVREAEDSQRAVMNLVKDLKIEEENLKKFKLAVDNSSDQIIITDPEATVLYINNATEKITGYTANEVIGKKAGIMWGGLMEKSFYENMWKTIKIDKKIFVGEITNKRKNNRTYTAIINISPIFDESKNILFFVGIERDITHEKEINKAKTEFVSLASHQLRTPLTGIEWTAELFSHKEKLSKEGQAYLDDIRFSAHRLNTLIKLLLSVSRIEGDNVGVIPKQLDLVKFIEDYTQEIRSLCKKKKLNLTFTKHPEKVIATTDANIFGYILQNIVANAINYTNTGGNIEIILEEKNGAAVLQVLDDGIGIPSNEQEHIFQKFVRASNAIVMQTDGTGLGLYIASESAKLLGGKIWFVSRTTKETVEGKTKDKGTAFFVEIPLVSQSRAGEKGLVV